MLDYNYFIKHKIIAIDLSKQQALDSDPKAMQQIDFNGNLENQSIFSIIEKAKENVLDCLQGTLRVFKFYFCFNIKMTQCNTLNVKLFKKLVKLLQMVHQLIWNFQKLNCLKLYIQEEF